MMIYSFIKSLLNPTRVRIITDGTWSLHEDATYLSKILNISHIKNIFSEFNDITEINFFLSRYNAIETLDRSKVRNARICFPYYHGYPHHGEDIFDNIFSRCIFHMNCIARVQVTHNKMANYLLEAGFPADKLQKIYIPVDTDIFKPSDTIAKQQLRKRMGVPQDAFVVGSFQKDGNGWEEGLSPKLVKGPDLLLATLALAKQQLPELFVVLTGPARGYVKRGLERLAIPYLHVFQIDIRKVANLFTLLDAYCITSRQEGGPKGLLEAMASGVPVISTPVGQVPEIAVAGESALVSSLPVDMLPLSEGNTPEVCEDLADKLCSLAQNNNLRHQLAKRGLQIAHSHDYRTQAAQWHEFCSKAME